MCQLKFHREIISKKKNMLFLNIGDTKSKIANKTFKFSYSQFLCCKEHFWHKFFECLHLMEKWMNKSAQKYPKYPKWSYPKYVSRLGCYSLHKLKHKKIQSEVWRESTKSIFKSEMQKLLSLWRVVT